MPDYEDDDALETANEMMKNSRAKKKQTNIAMTRPYKIFECFSSVDIFLRFSGSRLSICFISSVIFKIKFKNYMTDRLIFLKNL